jgi:cytochrome P450
MMTGRMCVRDTEVAGEHVTKGAFVETLLVGANRDPDVFADPHTFDVTRHNAREHISFSAGRHHCLGAALARMEGEVGLRAVFERFGDLRLAGGTRVLRGWAELPVILG